MLFPTSLAIGFLGLIIRCGCLPMDILADLSSPKDSSLAGALTRVKKNADGIGYLEECTFVDSWQEQPGFINVLAFLDASWEYSHRQANMLKMLQGRLERSGITGVKFFVINSAEPEAAVNNVDVDDEKDAWGAAEPLSDKAFSKLEQTRDVLREKIGPDIAFLQDNDTLKIWENLSAARDQVIVIDKCGRLSYRVIVPWSILHFPYVKAAILSTYKEQPCGGCSPETTTLTQEAGTESGMEMQTESELLPQNLSIKQMKEIAVKTYNLDETDYTVKKPYHGGESHDIPENIIELLNGSASLKHREKTNADLNNNNGTKHPPLMSSEQSNFDDRTPETDVKATNSTKSTGDNKEHGNALFVGDISIVTGSAEARDLSSTLIEESTDSAELITPGNLGNDNSNERSDYFEESDEGNKTEYMNTEISKSVTKKHEVFENNGYNNENISDTGVSNSSGRSSSEEIDNQINGAKLESGESNTSENSGSIEYVMPIRIIMHAPHIHEHDETMKQYEYLVLKLGNPEYHGHLHDKDFALDQDAGYFQTEKNGGTENEDFATGENEETEHGSGEFESSDAEKKKHGDHNKRQGGKHSRGKHLGIVYGKDESPGFYGEDSEYWRNFGNVGDQVNLQIERPEEKAEHETDREKLLEGRIDVAAVSLAKIDNDSTTVDENESEYQNLEFKIKDGVPLEEIIEGKEESDKNLSSIEEEIANKLFLHYSRLIPWLDYVIDE